MLPKQSVAGLYLALGSFLFILTSPRAASQTSGAPTSPPSKVMAPHQPIPPRVNTPTKWLTPAMKRSMIGGLWMTDANWKSAIYLRNGVETDPVTVTPILHLSNGVKYTLPDVTLQPAGNAIIDINQGLQQLGIASFATLSGYAEIQYTWPWDPFCVTIRNVDTAHSLIFTYGLQPTMPVPLNIVNPVVKTSTHTIEGMWWKQEANVTGFVALANTSSQPIQAAVSLTDNQANLIVQHSVTISPQGMKLVNLPELISASGSQGGVQITSSATTDNMIVNGGLEDQAVGYSANLPFARGSVTPSVSTATTIAELGLMAGAADPMMLFPAGTTFTPYSVLRNVSDAPISVTPTLWWMAGAVPHSAQLAPVSLLPHQTQTLDVMSFLSQAGLASANAYNGSFNLVFDANIKPGDLLLASGSVDQTNTYVFDVVARGVAESGSKSLQYWSIGNGDDTMVTLWNPADEAQDFVLTLFFALPDGSPGHYLWPVHLEPRATRGFNISEIVQNQIPDAEGNTIPAGVHEGGMKIAGSVAENQHILIAVDSGTYNVKKATCLNNCQVCDGYASVAVIPSSFSIAVNGTQQLTFRGTWGNGGAPYDLTGNATWTSDHISVATVSTGLVRGVSPGSATITARVDNAPVQASNPPGSVICTGPQGCPVTTFATSSYGTVIPTITGPNTVWWFNGQTPNSSSWPTQITLSTSANGSWAVTSGSSYVHLSSTSGSSITVSGTGTFSQGANDVSITVTVNGVTSGAFTMTSKGPKQLSNPASLSYACTGGETGWHYDKTYRVLDNFNNVVKSLPVGEGIGAPVSDRGDHLTFPAVIPTGGTTDASTGNFTDGILVCATGNVNPMPQNYTDGSGTSLVDHLSQAWCAGSSTSGFTCTGASVQNDTVKRYLDHGVVTIP